MQLAERLFQSFAPLNEKDFLPFSVPIFGNLRSVDVLRSLYEVLREFFLNKLRKYALRPEDLWRAIRIFFGVRRAKSRKSFGVRNLFSIWITE